MNFVKQQLDGSLEPLEDWIRCIALACVTEGNSVIITMGKPTRFATVNAAKVVVASGLSLASFAVFSSRGSSHVDAVNVHREFSKSAQHCEVDGITIRYCIPVKLPLKLLGRRTGSTT